MAKDDLVGGLALAIQKGETLEQAMMSFFSAGYKREEVEAAARTLYSPPKEVTPVLIPLVKKLSFFGKLFPKKPTLPVPLLNKPLTPVAETTKKLVPMKPAEVSVEKSGKVNKYLEIKTENLDNKLKKATLKIQVELKLQIRYKFHE